MGKLFNRKKHLFSEGELDDDIDDDIEEIDEDDDDLDEDEDDDDEDDDDDDEDDDDEDEDDDDEDDDDVEETDDPESRRSYRRKRRIRNQIISYCVVFVLFAGLIAGGVAAGRKISAVFREKKLAAEMEAAELETEQEHQPEDMVIETPPPVEVEVPTLDEQLEEIVNSNISTMPIEDKVAGLFIITPEALTGYTTVTQAGESTQEALRQYAVGGLIYFAQNIVDKEQVTEMLASTVSRSRYPIFLAVDEEGGSVSRVANSDIEVTKVEDMAVIGANGDTAAAHEAGVTIGTYLDELGFNLNFAPVADVTVPAETEGTQNGVIGGRSFGSDAAVCSDMVRNVVDGMQGTGVSACLKHFPGIGAATEDTHEGRVELDKTLTSMTETDFLPFQAGIEAGVDFIMVGHVIATSIDTEVVPCSLSKVMITDVLRGELGFDGVIITDALNMGAITEEYTSEEAAVLAIQAGADMLLMPDDFVAAYNGLLAAVQEGTISEERIDESLRRIYRIKCADKLE